MQFAPSDLFSSNIIIKLLSLFFIQPNLFTSKNLKKYTQPSCKQIVDCIFYLYSCISKLYTKKVIYILEQNKKLKRH